MKPNLTLTVATYNICHGHYAAFDWTRLAAPIRSVAPDLVGIQEVDMFTHRTRNMDTLHALAEAAGLPYARFIPTMNFDGGQYGTAVLSRFPIEEKMVLPLPDDGVEPRTVGFARILLDGTRSIWFVNTHLSYKSAEARHAQLSALRAQLDQMIPDGIPTVITGDFNTEDRLEPVVGDEYRDVNETRRYLTFRDKPSAIDRIIYTPATLSPTIQGMVESDASDHNLLWSRFMLI